MATQMGEARDSREAGQAEAAHSNADREKMAVRRRLAGLFQDPQLSGFITVERPVSRAGALCPSQFSSSLSPLPPATEVAMSPPATEVAMSPPATEVAMSPPATEVAMSPPTTEVATSPLQLRGPLTESCAVFHCRECWAVLGDSLHLCAQEEHQGLGFLVCFKVTKDVTWEDSLLIGLEGPLLGCAYNALCCRLCSLIVGFILYSAARDLAYLRGFFCFFEDRILCYVLKNQTIVEASKVNFPAVTLKEQVRQLKEKLVEIHNRIELLMKQLQELKQSNNVSEKQRSASDALGQDMQ